VSSIEIIRTVHGVDKAAFHENLRWLIPADRVLRLEHGPSGTTIVLEPLEAADTTTPSV